MRRTFGILLAVVVGVSALVLLPSRVSPARVTSKTDRIIVLPSTGQWYHNYVVHVLVSNEHRTPAPAEDSLSVTVARDVFDAMRTGARVRIGRNAIFPRIRWISDSSSVLQTLKRYARAQLKSYQKPAAISPLAAQTSGLARVVAVHRIQRRKFFWQKSGGAESKTRWLNLVEVEFWAPRIRTLVRSIDVIDAGSIPGLQTGDVLQMHYDQQDPRVVRLDDGRRTFESAAP